MPSITINLLPGEVKVLEKDLRKRSFLFKISIGILVGMIGFTSLILVLRLFQNRSVEHLNQQLQASQVKVAAYKNQEGLLVYLKQRLDTIRSLNQQGSTPVQPYNLVTALVPSSMDILLLNIDKPNTVIISTEAVDTGTIEQYFNNLLSTRTNQGKVSKIQIDSLSKGLGSMYKIDLTLTLN